MNKKVYIKDIDTLEYKEFDSLVECTKFVGLKSVIRGADVKRNIIVKNKYITAFNISEIKDYKRPPKAPRKKYPYKGKGKQKKEVFVYDLISNTITKEYDELINIAEKYNIKKAYLVNLIHNKVVYKKKLAFSCSDKEVFKLPVKKKKKNKVVKQKKLPTFAVFNLKKNTTTIHEDTLYNISKIYSISYSYLSRMLNGNIINKEGLAISENLKAFDNFKNELMKKKKFKKTNAQLKKQKVDLSENGDFVYREPNKPAKRIGKLGVDGIKNRLKNKR